MGAHVGHPSAITCDTSVLVAAFARWHSGHVAARDGIAGGAAYNLLIGLTARTADATLLTLDRRAAPTYRAAEVTYQFLTSSFWPVR